MSDPHLRESKEIGMSEQFHGWLAHDDDNVVGPVDTDTFRIDVAPTDDGDWTALCTLPNGRTWSYDHNQRQQLEVLLRRVGRDYERYLAPAPGEGLRLGDRPGRIDVGFLDARCGEWGSLEALLQACSNAMSVRASWADNNTDSRAVDALRRVADAITLSRQPPPASGEPQEPSA